MSPDWTNFSGNARMIEAPEGGVEAHLTESLLPHFPLFCRTGFMCPVLRHPLDELFLRRDVHLFGDHIAQIRIRFGRHVFVGRKNS